MAYKFDNISVIVVDSQPVMITLVRDVLKMFGIMKVNCFQDGQTGLEYFLKNDADIMVID